MVDAAVVVVEAVEALEVVDAEVDAVDSAVVVVVD